MSAVIERIQQRRERREKALAKEGHALPQTEFHLWEPVAPYSREVIPFGDHLPGERIINVLAIPTGRFLTTDDEQYDIDPSEWMQHFAHLPEVPPVPVLLPILMDAPASPYANAPAPSDEIVKVETPQKPKTIADMTDKELLAQLEREQAAAEAAEETRMTKEALEYFKQREREREEERKQRDAYRSFLLQGLGL